MPVAKVVRLTFSPTPLIRIDLFQTARNYPDINIEVERLWTDMILSLLIQAGVFL
jgi:hypothetical protein